MADLLPGLLCRPSSGLSPPAYAAFQTAATAVIPAEAAIYPSQALLPPTRTQQAAAAAAAAAAAVTPAVTYYPTQAAQLYMNYTAYYPRYYSTLARIFLLRFGTQNVSKVLQLILSFQCHWVFKVSSPRSS